MNYNTLIQIRCLEWYDGPLLIEYRDDKNNCYLFHWADLNDERQTIWCIYEVTNENLQKYLDNKLPLRDLYLNSKNEIVNVLIETNGGYELFKQLTKVELVEQYNDYLPCEGLTRNY